MRSSLPYVLLRKGLRAEGYNQEDVAALLERSRPYVSDRLNAKGEWLLKEAYALLKVIGAEGSELWRYFPADPYAVILPAQHQNRIYRVVAR